MLRLESTGAIGSRTVRLLATLSLSVLAALAFGGGVYGCVRYLEISALRRRVAPETLDERLAGYYFTRLGEHELRRLRLDANGRYRVTDATGASMDAEPLLESGTWSVRGDTFALRSEAGGEVRGTVEIDGTYLRLAFPEYCFDEPRPFECWQ